MVWEDGGSNPASYPIAQEKVRPGTGRETGLGHKVRAGTAREGGLGHVRYFAIEHKDKVRPGTGREGALGYVRREAFQFIGSL